jgi:hypothetical protein
MDSENSMWIFAGNGAILVSSPYFGTRIVTTDKHVDKFVATFVRIMVQAILDAVCRISLSYVFFA